MLRPPRFPARVAAWRPRFADDVVRLVEALRCENHAEGRARAARLSARLRACDEWEYASERARSVGCGALLQLWHCLLDLAGEAAAHEQRRPLLEDVVVVANRFEFGAGQQGAVASAYCAALERTAAEALRVAGAGGEADAFASRVMALVYLRMPAASGAVLNAVLDGAAAGCEAAPRAPDEPPPPPPPQPQPTPPNRDPVADHAFCEANPALFGWAAVARGCGGHDSLGDALAEARPRMATPAFFAAFFRAVVVHVEVASRRDCRGFWPLVPGYDALAAALARLLRHTPRGSDAWRPVLACAVRVGQADPEGQLEPLARAALRGTRTANRQAVEQVLGAVGSWAAALDPPAAGGGGGACRPVAALPGDVAQRLVPDLAAAVKALLDTDHFHLILRALVFVYDLVPRLRGPHRLALVRGVLLEPGRFPSLFAHWSSDVRLLFCQFLVFRTTRSGSGECARVRPAARAAPPPLRAARPARWLTRHLVRAVSAVRHRLHFLEPHGRQQQRGGGGGGGDDDDDDDLLHACDEWVGPEGEAGADRELADALARAVNDVSGVPAVYLAEAVETLAATRQTFERLQRAAAEGGVVAPRLRFCIPPAPEPDDDKFGQ